MTIHIPNGFTEKELEYYSRQIVLKDFGIIDKYRLEQNIKPMRVSDHEGRDINGDIKRGMYERLNPNKLRPSVYSYAPNDKIIVIADEEIASLIRRKMPFAIAENEPTGKFPVGSERHYKPYLQDVICLCYDNHRIPIYVLDKREQKYPVEQNQEN